MSEDTIRRLLAQVTNAIQDNETQRLVARMVLTNHHLPQSIVEARARMIVRAIYFSCILYDQAKMRVIPSGEDTWSGVWCPTAMTDGMNLVVNLDFMEGLSIGERVFVLAHEIYHLMAMCGATPLLPRYHQP